MVCTYLEVIAKRGELLDSGRLAPGHENRQHVRDADFQECANVSAP